MMSAPPSTEGEPRVDAQRGPSLAAYVGLVVAFLGLAVLMTAGGVVDDRIAPLWNPAVVAAASIGLHYAEPRPRLWQAGFGGALIGVAYAAFVLAADALTALQIHLGPAELLLRAVAIGVGPPLVGGLLLRWLAPTSSGGRPR